MNRAMKMLVSAILCIAMIGTALVGLVACGEKKTDGTNAATTAPSNPNTDPIKVGGSVIIGSSTEITGSDLASSTWGNGAADKDIRDLTNGYACVQQNKAGEESLVSSDVKGGVGLSDHFSRKKFEPGNTWGLKQLTERSQAGRP